MKRGSGALMAVMMMVVTAPAMAGDASKCTASTQDCLNHMAKNLNNRGWVGIEMDDKGDPQTANFQILVYDADNTTSVDQEKEASISG